MGKDKEIKLKGVCEIFEGYYCGLKIAESAISVDDYACIPITYEQSLQPKDIIGRTTKIYVKDHLVHVEGILFEESPTVWALEQIKSKAKNKGNFPFELVINGVGQKREGNVFKKFKIRSVSLVRRHTANNCTIEIVPANKRKE